MSVSPVGYLPLMRYIIPLFKKDKTEIITTYVKDSYSYQAFGNQKNLHVFPSINDLNSHSKFVWLKKYILVLAELLRIIFSMKKTVIYSVDVQVVALAIMVTRMFRNRIKIVYHQFELLDLSQSSGFNRKLQEYVLRNADEINLIVFPEITRSQFFFESSQKASYDSILVPNTNDLYINNREKIKPIKGIPDDHIVIAHVGSIGPFHYVRKYIDFIRSDNTQKVSYLFVGNMAPEVSSFLRSVAEADPRVVVIGELPHADLLDIYHRINIGVILYKGVDINTEYCAPNKLYEYWAHGIPVMAHKLTGLIPIWKYEFQGKIIDFENPEEISLAIHELLSNWREYKAPLRKYFQEHLSLDHFLPILKNKILDLA